MKVIIVGGVAGGASCAARLRRLDERAEILMVERGPYVSYANCGLPYHIGGVIEKESSLLVATEQTFRAQFAIDCRTRCEVVGISSKEKTVELKNHVTGKVTTEPYDKLVLSPGAAPIRPPLPGIDLPGIFSVRTVPDAREIREWIERGSSDSTGEHMSSGFPLDKTKRAVVVGGGYIGLEMAENLVHRGLEVTVVEMLDQVMAPLDPECARLVERHMEKHGVRLALNDGVSGFKQTATGSLEVLTKSGKVHPADVVILAIGVRPETSLAKMAGIEIGQRGGIRVDEHFRRRRRGGSQGFRHRRVVPHRTRRACEPAGPDRGRCDRRTQFPLPRHPGHLGHGDLRRHNRSDRRQRKASHPPGP
jgi:NADPH-dependent 2,4-dienoyl-CoA reductase/sulfur reductase-like enzyme